MSRSRSLAWLWLIVALQVAIPASYYLRGGDDPDERFAWRMFSAVRMQRCRVRARTEDGSGGSAEVQLTSTLHSSWVNALERGRQRVIERFLATRCQDGIRAAELERRCEGVTRGVRGPTNLYRFDCRSRQLSEAQR